MTDKLIGYILITLGMVLIIYSLFSVYSVFNGMAKPYSLFNFDGVNIEIDPSSITGEEVVSNAKSTTFKQEILPAKQINDTTNIFAHLLLMGFIASIGLKIATIGTQLARTIIVKTSDNAQRKTLP